MNKTSKALCVATICFSIAAMAILHLFLPELVTRFRYKQGSVEHARELEQMQQLSRVMRYQHDRIGAYGSSSNEYYYVTGYEAVDALKKLESTYIQTYPGSDGAENNVNMDGMCLFGVLFVCFSLLKSVNKKKSNMSVHQKEVADASSRSQSKTTNGQLPISAHKSNCVSKKILDVVDMTQYIGKRITFDDIAGYDQTKESLLFIVRCLKERELLEKAGARLPHGIILYGPPGTGKTLLAAAVAGTAGVPFLSVNAASFVNVYVGTGPAAVRELYQKARNCAPCVVFIDEVDAVGRKRENVANPEYANTTNALLSELDGLSSIAGVLTIAATNTIESLDEAFIRPGRFDRKVMVPLPNLHEREAILKLHCQNKKLARDVSLPELAQHTSGMSGADLATLINEAAICAVSRGTGSVERSDIEYAFFQLSSAGEELLHDQADATVVAWHEAGHAICMRLLARWPVMRVSIRETTTGYAGTTMHPPVHEHLTTRKDIETAVMCLYAGRIAEELFLGNAENVTITASGDISEASQLLRDYLTKYGLGEAGMLNLDLLTANPVQERLITEAVSISTRLYQETKSFLRKHAFELRAVANELVKKKVLSGKDIDDILERSSETG